MIKINSSRLYAKTKKSFLINLIPLAIAATISQPAYSIDVDAGDYTALPVGTNLAVLYYQNASRDSMYSQGAKAAGNNKLDSDVGILRGVHFMELGGYTIDPQFLLPFGNLDAGGDLDSVLGEESGVGDLILASTIWLVNKPAENTYFGLTPYLYVPTGTYDHNETLNLGENRWKFALQAGYITNITDKIAFDIAADVTYFGDNDEFGAGKATLKQEPAYQLQSYLRYQINPSWDIRAGISQSWGGETEVNGVKQNDEAEITKASLGTSYFVAPDLQLMVNYGQDLDVENGFKEDHRLNFRLLKVF
jgi:hypothetical protein